MQNIRLKGLYIFLLIISIIALDLYTKFVVSGDNNTIIVSSFIKLHTINNYGIAFSLFDGLQDGGRLLLSIVILIVLIFVAYELYKNLRSSINYILGLSLVLGGGVANFIDRFDNGSVTDFIILHYENIYFPAVFNIADLSISIGAIFIIFHLVGIPRGSNQI
ncbi:MAG: lipoprotein signal peptidase [Ectothiorhodospiraceae bacterium]|nr:MAG: lipoprotein signal peptidase [Ectothiorhodospiraceae bacterium]